MKTLNDLPNEIILDIMSYNDKFLFINKRFNLLYTTYINKDYLNKLNNIGIKIKYCNKKIYKKVLYIKQNTYIKLKNYDIKLTSLAHQISHNNLVGFTKTFVLYFNDFNKKGNDILYILLNKYILKNTRWIKSIPCHLFKKNHFQFILDRNTNFITYNINLQNHFLKYIPEFFTTHSNIIIKCFQKETLYQFNNLIDKNNNNLLNLLILNNKIDINDLLNNDWTNINLINNLGKNALTYAIYNKNIKIINFLLFKINPTDSDIINIFNIHNLELIQNLLSFPNINLHVTDSDGNSLLMKFIDNYEITKLILSRNIDINLQNKNGETVLMLSNDINIIKMILEKNPNMDLQNNNGDTVLIKTIKSLNHIDEFFLFDLFNIIIDKTQNLYIKNKKGETALSLAKNKNISFVTKKIQFKLLFNL